MCTRSGISVDDPFPVKQLVKGYRTNAYNLMAAQGRCSWCCIFLHHMDTKVYLKVVLP